MRRPCLLPVGVLFLSLVCASCGSLDTELLRGQDLILSRVELVRDTPAPAPDISTEENHVH